MTPTPWTPERILWETRTIAVLFANPRVSAPAHYVPAYLAQKGYRVLPIHPAPVHAGTQLFGQPMRQSLAQIDEPVDLVNVFRRADAILSHVPEILAMTHRPRFVWFQQGLRNEEAAAALEREGIVVVQDRCTLADHRAFFG